MSSTRIHRPIRTYTQGLGEKNPGTRDVPFGSYKYESAKADLPAGLFHYVRDGDLYVPTLHGLTAEYIRTLKDVAVCTVNSAMANRPFLNAPHMYEVELINTGHDSLKQGDRFTVQIPNGRDVLAQQGVSLDPGYDLRVNKAIWGGLLATRRVNTESGGDCVEELLNAIREDDEFDAFQLLSPYTPHSTHSMLTLVANGGQYNDVSGRSRDAAADAANGQYSAHTIQALISDNAVRTYLQTVMGHALTIAESVQGFAGGQVVRSCKGYTTSDIHTGERFFAQLNPHRWLA